MLFTIGSKLVGEDQPCFIIAELSANHNQNIDLANKTIEAAKIAGADAIKFQTFTPDTITINSDEKYFKINQNSLWDGKTLYDLYSEAYMPWEWHEELKKNAEDLGLICFSSPFDKTAVDFLENIDVPAYKIASPEITDIPLIEYVASKGKPIIISTGIATFNDLDKVMKACEKEGNNDIAFLKCTSAYPTPYNEANLRSISTIKDKYNTIVGLSDHTKGDIAPLLSIPLGAKIIEKHFILDKNIESLDSKFSLDKEEFSKMVHSIRISEEALGSKSFPLTDNARKSRVNCRSLFIYKDIKAGEYFSEKNIKSVRPGQGVKPEYFKYFIGKKSRKFYKKGTPVAKNMLSKNDIDKEKIRRL